MEKSNKSVMDKIFGIKLRYKLLILLSPILILTIFYPLVLMVYRSELNTFWRDLWHSLLSFYFPVLIPLTINIVMYVLAEIKKKKWSFIFFVLYFIIALPLHIIFIFVPFQIGNLIAIPWIYWIIIGVINPTISYYGVLAAISIVVLLSWIVVVFITPFFLYKNYKTKVNLNNYKINSSKKLEVSKNESYCFDK